MGDVGPFAKYHNSGEYTQFVRAEGNLDAAVLPISSSRLLVGERDGFCFRCTPETVNVISAELSRDFYVASRKTPESVSYLAFLGRRKGLITEKDMFGM